MAVLPPIPYDKPQTSFEWIDWYTKLIDLVNSGTQHNDLPGLQGGTTGEYYHLTSAQHANVVSVLTNLNETIDDRVAALLTAGANITLTYNDVANTLTIASTGGSGSTWTETEIDFGTTPVWDKSFTVTDAGVTGSSKIIITASGNAPSGRHSDDWQWDSINFAAVAGTGQFTLYANADGPVEGKRNIYYQVV